MCLYSQEHLMSCNEIQTAPNTAICGTYFAQSTTCYVNDNVVTNRRYQGCVLSVSSSNFASDFLCNSEWNMVATPTLWVVRYSLLEGLVKSPRRWWGFNTREYSNRFLRVTLHMYINNKASHLPILLWLSTMSFITWHHIGPFRASLNILFKNSIHVIVYMKRLTSTINGNLLRLNNKLLVSFYFYWCVHKKNTADKKIKYEKHRSYKIGEYFFSHNFSKTSYPCSNVFLGPKCS